MSGEITSGTQFSTFEEQDKVLVALSGGVDSSVCIQILQQQGFAVHAVVIRFSPAHDKAVAAAQTVAAQLGVPLTVEDCTDLFEEQVITPFCESYCNGITPSPCVHCNPNVKFKALARAADKAGIHLIATGHYACLTQENGFYYISKAASVERDQSYMLYGLQQDILSRLCLPVGEFEKPDIREMAKEANLASADAPDSQEICFIPDGDYAAYIKARGLQAKQGRFIGPNGEDLGAHKGVLHYTVGQRRGLHIAYGEPVFVKRILENGNIQLALAGDEFYTGVTLRNLTRADGKQFCAGETYDVKIRSRAKPSACTITALADGMLTLQFSQPLRAPAPGQSAVLYSGDLVIGGGVVTDLLEA